MSGIAQVTKALTPEEIARVETRQNMQKEKDETAAAIAAMGLPEFAVGLGYEREMSVPLMFPFTYDGVMYDQVVIRRPRMKEWRAYLRACADAVKIHGPNADDWVDQPWLSISAIVLENLDFNDAAKVEAASNAFFARSLSDQKLLKDGVTVEELETLKAVEAEALAAEMEDVEMTDEDRSLLSTSTTGEQSP